MKVKVPGCSICKKPYDWKEQYLTVGHKSTAGLKMFPTCKNDKKHKHGYFDILIEVESK